MELLTKLISEESEAVQYPLDQFEADKDHESLIENLARVLDKIKQTGYQKMGPQQFFQTYDRP